jgi:replicative DNA helicase
MSGVYADQAGSGPSVTGHLEDGPDAPGRPAVPFNLQAEQSVLGALMMDSHRLEDVGDILGKETFHDPVHGAIYDRMVKLRQAGTVVVDGVLLQSEFAGDGSLAAIGGAKYLGELILAACDPYALVTYAELLSDLHTRRKLLALSNSLRDRACAPSSQSLGAATVQWAAGALADLEPEAAYQPVAAMDAMAEAINDAEAARVAGKPAGISTGLPWLDTLHGTLKPGHLIILGGRPGMGKSGVAIEIARKVAAAGVGVGYFSPEMGASEHGERIACALAREAGVMIEYQDVSTGKCSQRQIRELSRFMSLSANWPLLIDDRSRLPFDALAARFKALHRASLKRFNKPVGLFIVDHLGLIAAPSAGSGRNRVDEISMMTAELKRIAGDMGATILLLAQLNRKLEERPDKRPLLNDLRESGSIEQDANSVILAYREAYYLEKDINRLVAAGTGHSPDAEKARERLREVADTIELDVAKRRGGRGGRGRFSFEVGYNLLSELKTGDDGSSTQESFL